MPAAERTAAPSPTNAAAAHNWHVVGLLDEFAARRGHTLLDLAMSWLASRPFVGSIIAGATKPDQIAQNVAAVGWALTPADLIEIDRITLLN